MTNLKITKFDSEAEWLDARRGKITGTRLKDLVSKRGGAKKIGYYELIAERVAIPPTEENVMNRGKRLEDLAIERFVKETGKVVDNDLIMWTRKDDENIAVSPDGQIGMKEAIECKCLSSARFIEALLTKKIPDEYDHQVIQYFIVNDELEILYFVFYDPRMPKDFFYITVKREDIQVEIEEYFILEKEVLAEISEIEKLLTF